MSEASTSMRRGCATLVRAQIAAHAPPLHHALEHAFARDVTPFGWSHRTMLQDLGIASRAWPSTAHIPRPIAIVESTTYEAGRPTESAIFDLASRGGTILVETGSIARVAKAIDARTETRDVPQGGGPLLDVELPKAKWLGAKLGVVRPDEIRHLAPGGPEILACHPRSRAPLVVRTRVGKATVVTFAFSMSPSAPKDPPEPDEQLTIAGLAKDLGLAPPAATSAIPLRGAPPAFGGSAASDESASRATLVAAYTSMAIVAWTIAEALSSRAALTPPGAAR